MSDGTSLKKIMSVLAQIGGYLTVPDDEGTEYVIMRRDEYERRVATGAERQLDLLSQVSSRSREGSATADEVLDKINRDIALFQLQQTEFDETGPLETSDEVEQDSNADTAAIDDLSINAGGTTDQSHGLGKKVRFEPLRGDLPPDLQE